MNKSLILLHGLNNPPEVLETMAKHFESKGFKVHLFNLFGHKKNQALNHLTLKECLHHIHYQMLAIPKENEIYFLGFSQGALIFQLYQMMKINQHKIKSQVLLAPALYIKRQGFMNLVIGMLSENMKIPSRAPKEFRVFDKLSVGYYKELMEQVKVFHKHGINHLTNVPTLILADAKDELIDMNRLHAEMLKNNMDSWKIIYLNRDLKHIKHYGKHHIMFNQNYFTDTDWNSMIREMETQYKTV